MAERHWFGQSPADWTFTVGAGNVPVLDGGVPLTAWNQAAGGVQYTDLLDASGAPVTQIESGNGGVLPVGVIPQFQGPAGVTSMWIDGGGGVRYLLVATDLGDQVAATAEDLVQADEQIEDLQAAVASRLPAILWDQASGTYPARTPDLAGLQVQWVGPATPPTDVLHAVAGDTWAKTIV